MPDLESQPGRLAAGVCPELAEAAELALEACQILGWADVIMVDSVHPQKEAVVKLFGEFSATDVTGLRTMVDDLTETMLVCQWDSEPGADLDRLIRDLGELRAGVEATRRLITGARADLAGLARSFHADAMRYCMTKAPGDSASPVFRSFFDRVHSLRRAVRKAARALPVEGFATGQPESGSGPIARSA